MHMHIHLRRLDELPHRENEFYRLVVRLFDAPFEEGNLRIANFILAKKLFTSHEGNVVDCHTHVARVLNLLELPTSAFLHCNACNINENFP